MLTDKELFLEMANIPPQLHGFGVEVKLQLFQPGKITHAQRVRVFRGDPNKDDQCFVVTLREDPTKIEYLEGKVFLSKKELDLVIAGIKKYRIPFLIFWYSPGMDSDELKALMKQVDEGKLTHLPENLKS